MKGSGTADLRHKVGHCPGCREYIWAAVTVDTEVRPPGLNSDGVACANVTARITRVILSHDCSGRSSQ